MKALLFQIAFLLGGGSAIISLGINIVRKTDLLTSVLRAGIVFCISTIIVVFFLHFFALVLHRFVAEEMLRQHQKQGSSDAKDQNRPEESARRTARGRAPSPKLEVPGRRADAGMGANEL